jgi:hypothetical protein
MLKKSLLLAAFALTVLGAGKQSQFPLPECLPCAVDGNVTAAVQGQFPLPECLPCVVDGKTISGVQGQFPLPECLPCAVESL